jgi:hypothetical protein
MFLLNTKHASPKKNTSSHVLLSSGTNVNGKFSTYLCTLLHSTVDGAHLVQDAHVAQGLPMSSLWPAEYISQVHWDNLGFIVIKDSGQVSAHSSQSVVSGNNKATELANTPLHQVHSSLHLGIRQILLSNRKFSFSTLYFNPLAPEFSFKF